MPRWSLASHIPSVTLAVAVDTGAGTLTCALNQFAVSGTWTTGVTGQNAAAFNLRGADDLKAVTYVAGVDVVEGSIEAPTQIAIWFSESSAGTGDMASYQAVLKPIPQPSPS